jgi:hypothetical protein
MQVYWDTFLKNLQNIFVAKDLGLLFEIKLISFTKDFIYIKLLKLKIK